MDHGELLFQLLATFLRTLACASPFRLRIPMIVNSVCGGNPSSIRNGNLNYPRRARPLAPNMCRRKKGLFPRNGDLGIVPLYERVRRYPKPAFPSRAEGDFPRNSALPARGCSPSPYFWPFGGSNVGIQPLAPVGSIALQTTRGQTMLSNADKRWFKSQGGPGEILVSVASEPMGQNLGWGAKKVERRREARGWVLSEAVPEGKKWQRRTASHHHHHQM